MSTPNLSIQLWTENLCWNSCRSGREWCRQSAQMSGGESPESVSCSKGYLSFCPIVTMYTFCICILYVGTYPSLTCTHHTSLSLCIRRPASAPPSWWKYKSQQTKKEHFLWMVSQLEEGGRERPGKEGFLDQPLHHHTPLLTHPWEEEDTVKVASTKESKTKSTIT